MNEVLTQMLADLVFIVRSLVFWGWLAGGVIVGYLLALVIARVRLDAGAQPYSAAIQGIVWGYVIVALLMTVALYYLWFDAIVVLLLIPVVLVLIPWIIASSLQRSEARVG